MSEKTIRCTDCASTFSYEELNGQTACPTCGTKSIPCDIANDVDIHLNWHELRILTIWASNWSEKCDAQGKRTLASIIKRLEDQHPGRSPLTLAGEIKQLASMGTIEVLKSDGTREVIPHKKPD